MNPLKVTALATFMVTTVAIAALAPTAFAASTQPTASDAVPVAAQHTMHRAPMARMGMENPMGNRMGHHPMMGRAMAGSHRLLNFTCAPNGAEKLDVGLLRLKYRLKLTDAQMPLYNTLHDTVLAQEKSFAATCKSTMTGLKGDKNMMDRLDAGLTIEKAKLAAMTEVMPEIKALYTTLSDQQKAALKPTPRAGHGARNWNRQGQKSHNPKMQDQEAPGSDAVEAPTADTTSPA